MADELQLLPEEENKPEPGIDENNLPEAAPAVENKKGRVTKSVNFTQAEFDQLEKVFKARYENKIRLSNDWNHLIRQCICFSVNHDKVAAELFGADPGETSPSFAVPTGTDIKFKDSFFNS